MGLRELSPELAKKAEDELFEDPKRIPQDLKAIKEWIAKQPHLNIRTDDQWLLGFLRGCKFSLERTKEKLDLFYTLRSAAPELCTVGDPMDPKIQEILKLGVAVILPKTEKPDDPRVMLMRSGIYDPDKIHITDIMRVNYMFFCTTILDDDQSIIAGIRWVGDMSNMSMGHFTQMTPSLMKKMIMLGQDATPIRQKGTHHINLPSAAETIVSFVLRLLNEKNRSRYHVHKDMDDFNKYVPKSILPTEYGGDAGPIQDMIDETKKKIESKRDWFLEEAKYKTDESKRPGKPKTAETLFGIEGSFRQLNVD